MLGEGRAEGEEAQAAVCQVPGDVEVVTLLWVPAGRGAEPVDMQYEAEGNHGDGGGQGGAPVTLGR
jgi:hypothetical protein